MNGINGLNRWLGPLMIGTLLAVGTVSAAFASSPCVTLGGPLMPKGARSPA